MSSDLLGRDQASELTAYDGMTIADIRIDNRNIYDTRQPRYGGFLYRTANRFHFVTRPEIVRRELLFAPGEPFSSETAEETARNLRARLAVNDAWIEVTPAGDGQVNVTVITVDQWSLLGGLRSFSREGGVTDFRVGLEDRNLLGRARFASLDYSVRGRDPNFVTAAFREPRLLSRRLAFGFDYRSDPYNTLRTVSVGRPFYDLAQRFTFDIDLSWTAARQLRFNDRGDSLAQWHTAGDIMEADIGYRLGPYHRKLTFLVAYKYLYQAVSGRLVWPPEPYAAADFPVDSVYHMFSLGASYGVRYFIVEKRINGFDVNEDFTTGVEGEGQYGRALAPDFDDNLYDFFGARVSTAFKLKANLFQAAYARSFWFKNSAYSRRLTEFTLAAYNNSLSFVTLALRSYYAADKGDDAHRLVLGGKSGLRGYATETASGNRLHVINLEGRFFWGLEILSVKLGSAVFADLGRTWSRGEAVAIRDYRASVGAGLRFSFERFTRNELVRMDAAYIGRGEWELSVSTGQYF